MDRAWREANRERRAEYNRDYYEANKERQAERYRWATYRLTPERYKDMLEAQQHRCASCRTKFDVTGTPHVDHDHRCCPGARACGECVRALLCRTCNHLAGFMEQPIPGAADPVLRARQMLRFLDAWYGEHP